MIRSGIRIGVGVAFVGFALALTGCAPTVSHTDAGSTPTRTSTPSAPPTASKPTLSQLVVTPDGLSYLSPGVAVHAEPAALAIMTYDPTNCVGEEIAAGSPGAGAWVPAYPNSITWAGAGKPFDVGPVNAPTDPIHEVEIWSPSLKTAKGIGPGSTVAQLTAAYGATLTLDEADNSDVYVLPGTRSELLFEVAKAAAGLPAEETGTVVWMRIVPLDDAYLHIADTDATGPCSF
jgi:hypothetical protein